MSPLSKEETCRDSLLAFIICHYIVIKTVFLHFCVFVNIVLLAVRMVADVIETRYIITSLEFKTKKP